MPALKRPTISHDHCNSISIQCSDHVSKPSSGNRNHCTPQWIPNTHNRTIIGNGKRSKRLASVEALHAGYESRVVIGVLRHDSVCVRNADGRVEGIVANLCDVAEGVGEKTRITNDPRSPAPPRRAGHLQSIWRVRHSRARHFQAMRGHPTDCRRDHSERVLRAARPPVAFHSLRNSLDMYLRGISSSERTIPTRIIV